MIRVVVGFSSAVLCFATCLAPSRAFPQGCDTLPILPVDFDSVRVFQFNGGANCWGWIAPDGTKYAIMGTQDGVGFVNVNTMTIADHVPANFCSWRELKTYRNYCYVVSECLGDKEGMMIIDMSYLPDSVHYVRSYIRSDSTNKRSHCISIDTARGYCYLVRQNYSGFRIVSLANPEMPVDVGSVVTFDLHDMTAFNDTVYAAEGSNREFSIWDCTNKSSPVQLANVNISGGGYVHNIWPTADRRTLVTTEETGFKTVKIWNSADFANIQRAAEYLGPSNLAHNAHIEGHYAYLSHYESGVSVLDISNPASPAVVALFDTYLLSDNPSFNGCWGVYPHTSNSGLVYASNIEGQCYIFQTNIVSATVSGGPLVGDAPLTVSFSGDAYQATDWKWYFGDGDSSATQNPTHEYGPGLFTVRLEVQAPIGTGYENKCDFVTALAETLKVDDTTALPNSSVMREIWYHNYVPLEEIKLTIDLSNVPEIAAFDSITTSGCRTSNFEQKQIVFDNRNNGQMAIRLNANAGGGTQPLPPGDGPIARVWFRVKSNAMNGQQVVLSMPPMGSQLQHTLSAFTLAAEYVPEVSGGTTTVFGACDCSCHADPVCDGLSDALDVVSIVDAAFRGANPIIDTTCPHIGRQDVNCSNQIDILDVVTIVNVVFRGADPNSELCDPCTI